MRKLISLALVLVICVTAVPAWGADNSKVDAKIAQLEKTFGVAVRYDTDADGAACIGTGTLATLEMVLNSITPQVTNQVSAYVQGKTGRKITYSFTYNYNVNIALAADTEAHAVFHPDTGIIEVFLPSSSRGTLSSGDNPLAMTHEFGHALYMLLESKYGAASLAADWKALGGSLGYKGSYSGSGVYDTKAFITEYAASVDHEEDFCETFAHALVRSRDGMGFYYLLKDDAGSKTVLGKKVDFLMQVLPKGLTDTTAIVANLNRAYTTRIYLDWQGQRLTGSHMQYINCSYPRYVLKGIMGEIKVEIASSQWVYEIGGWYVEGTNGSYYLVWPGGVVRQQPGPIAALATA